MKSDDMGEALTLELQLTSEYSSTVDEIEDCNEDATQNTETSGYENFDWALFTGFRFHRSEIEDTATRIKYAVCKSKIDIYIEWQ
ncbi:hypothetical protein V8E54_001038 [Elaphomyces granulatus]